MEYTFSDKLFGDRIEITIYDVDPVIAEVVAGDAYSEALRLQKIFNLYDKDSEISQLNRKREMECSGELLETIRKALEYCRVTGGRYDISQGSLFLSRKKNAAEDALSCSYKDIEISGNRISLLNNDAIIDLGSIAKGYIVDKVVEFISRQGVMSGMVNGRGDIRVFGDSEHTVDIQHPRARDRHIASIKVSDEAIATSGDYNQYSQSFDKSHLLNNRHFSSVTVIAKTLETADLLATVISVMDRGSAEKLLAQRKDVKAVTIDKSMQIRRYNIAG